MEARSKGNVRLTSTNRLPQCVCSILSISKSGPPDQWLCLLSDPNLAHIWRFTQLVPLQRDGNDLTEEGQILFEDLQLWLVLLTSLWECLSSRKRELTPEDDTFLLHNKGTITSTFTGDCLLTSVVVRSTTARNRTNTISVNRCGYHRGDSPQKKFFLFRL